MALRSLVEAFSIIEDPRVKRTRLHDLTDILVLAVLAVMTGAEGWEDIEDYGKVRLAWLRKLIPLKNGVPSHDTISRVFRAIKPDVFQKAFLDWTRSFQVQLKQKHIAIDGKSMRSSHDRAVGKKMLHSVMAWCSDNASFLGQKAVDEKSNEITAIPELLEQLDLKGSIITIDAMGCQTQIAEQINQGEGHYLLAVKGNQESLSKLMYQEYEKYHSGNSQLASRHQLDAEVVKHGRTTKREYFQLQLSEDMRSANSKWIGLETIVQVITSHEDHSTGKSNTEVRYYISSLPLGIRLAARSIRQHWSIESMHWVLDVTFREDESRIRKDHSDENFGLLRRFALQLLKQDTSSTRSIKKKRKLAGWEKDFLIDVLKAMH